MTQIIYTITLVNSDGTQAQASTAPVDFRPIRAEDLQPVADFQANVLHRGAVATMEAIRQTQPRAAHGSPGSSTVPHVSSKTKTNGAAIHGK